MKENKQLEAVSNQASFEKKYSPGKIEIINGLKYVADENGTLVRVLKSGTGRSKPKWADVKSNEITYDKGKYEVAVVRDENNENFEIVVIRQWLTDGQGNSTIKNKSGKDIPKRVFVIPANKDLLKQIGKSLQEILEDAK